MKEGYLVKKLIIIIFFALVLSATTNAELIDGPANIRENPNGQILFSLNDNVPIGYKVDKDGWYNVSLTVCVKENDFSNEKGIIKGAKLFDSAMNEIGNTLDAIPLSYFIGGNPSYNKEDHIYTCTINGYTFRDNLKDNISTVSIAERIKVQNKKSGSFLDIAKSYIELNQKDFAKPILIKSLENINSIGVNPDFEGNSYDENDEKAYKLRDLAVLYYQIGEKSKAIEIMNNAIQASKTIQGACDQYTYRDKALEDLALDFINFGEYDLCIKTIKLTSKYMADGALSKIVDYYLEKNDINTAKKTVELIKNESNKEQALINISLKDVNLKNIETYIDLIRSFKDDNVKCLGLAELAVRYFIIKGDGNKITSDLLNESIEIAKKNKNNYQRDDFLAEIAGHYAEVKQFEKGKSLALSIKWSIDKAKGLMNIAILYGKIHHPNDANNLLDQAWDITNKSEGGLDQDELLQSIIGAYGDCGLVDKSLIRAKSIGFSEDDAQYYDDALLTVALCYSKNKQPESALDALQAFKTNVRDQMKAGAIGDIIDQLDVANQEKAIKVLTEAIEQLDSIADRDWKYLNTLINEDYSKIVIKYIQLKQYDTAIQIINQKFPNYDDKVVTTVRAILFYNKTNKEIDKDREDFINKISELTLNK